MKSQTDHEKHSSSTMKSRSEGEVMKAIRIHARGGPEQLVYEDAPIPQPGTGDALVRVYATGITPAELSWSTTYEHPDGSERIPSIPGHELSGVVEALGAEATGVKVGDEVYGLTDFPRDGAAAEYVAVQANDLAPKPKTLNHARAASIPLSGLTAWQALFDHAGLAKGQRILIHAGAGGVGTLALQLARWKGAYVVATASARNVRFVHELGANEVIDYTKGRFEEMVGDIDVVLDTVGGETYDRSWRVLRPHGMLVTITVFSGVEETAKKHGRRGVAFIVKPSRIQLVGLGRLIDNGELHPVVEEILPLPEARRAFERGSRGHTRGKLVLRVAESAAAKA